MTDVDELAALRRRVALLEDTVTDSLLASMQLINLYNALILDNNLKREVGISSKKVDVVTAAWEVFDNVSANFDKLIK